MLQVKIIFRLKFFKLGWFSPLSPSLIIHELGLGVQKRFGVQTTGSQNSHILVQDKETKLSTYRLIGLGTTHITSVCGNFHNWFNLCASCNNSPHNSKFTNTISFHFTDCTSSMVAKMFEVHLTENKWTNLHHPLKMFWVWNYNDGSVWQFIQSLWYFAFCSMWWLDLRFLVTILFA